MHLCKDIQCPPYSNVVRSRNVPFYRFNHEDGRPYALLESSVRELDLSANSTLNTEINPNTPSPLNRTKNTPNTQDIVECLEWMLNHVEYLKTSCGGHRQLEYIASNVLPSLQKYRLTIQQDQNSKRLIPTCNRPPATFWAP